MLRSIGRPQTSAGAVTLRMHVGLQQRPLPLLPRRRRAPRADRRAARRPGARSSSRTPPRPATSCSRRDRGGARAARCRRGEGRRRARCGVEPGRRGARRAAAADRRARPRARVPVARAGVRDGRRRSSPSTARRRSRSCASAASTGSLERERARGGRGAAVDELVARRPARPAREHGVTFLESDIDRDGGRIVLVAGAPQTGGRGRGPAAADRARDRRRADDARPSQVGVNRGRVFAGEVGARVPAHVHDPRRHGRARRAADGARAAGPDPRRRAGARARAHRASRRAQLEPFTRQGQVAAGASRTSCARARRARSARGVRHLPLVDRQRELAMLGASLAPARAGLRQPRRARRRHGDRQVAARRGDARAVRGHDRARRPPASRTTRRPPTAPSATLLRGLLEVARRRRRRRANSERSARARSAAIAPELVPWLPLLALPLDLPVLPTRETDELDPAFRRARLHGVVGTLLGPLLAAPDAARLRGRALDGRRLVRAPAPPRHRGDEPALVRARHAPTRRGQGFSAADGTPPLPALTMRLEPLPADDARALVAAAAGRRSPARTTSTRSSSAPAATRSSSRSSSRRRTDGGRRGAAGERRGGRDRAHRRALARRPGACCAGRRCSGCASASACSPRCSRTSESAAGAEAWDRLDEFLERDPNVAGGFRFRQAVFRDAAYEGLSYPPAARAAPPRGGGLRAAGGGGRPRVAEMLSLHWSRAGDHERTWRYSLAAGDAARRRSTRTSRRRASTAARSRPHGALPGRRAGRGRRRLGGARRRRRARRPLPRRRSRRTAAAAAREPALGPQPGLLLKEGVIREREGQLLRGAALVHPRARGRIHSPGRPGAPSVSRRLLTRLRGRQAPAGPV